MSIASFPVFRRSDVVFIVFTLQNVDSVSRNGVNDFLFQAPPARKYRFSDSPFCRIPFSGFLYSGVLIILFAEWSVEFLDILSYYTISFVALLVIERLSVVLRNFVVPSSKKMRSLDTLMRTVDP